jgi:hypothetical protein
MANPILTNIRSLCFYLSILPGTLIISLLPVATQAGEFASPWLGPHGKRRVLCCGKRRRLQKRKAPENRRNESLARVGKRCEAAPLAGYAVKSAVVVSSVPWSQVRDCVALSIRPIYRALLVEGLERSK